MKYNSIIAGHWISLIGSSIFAAGIAWHLTQTYGASTSSFILAFAQFLPVAFMLPLSFLIVDNFPKFWIILVCDLVRGFTCLGLSALYFMGENSIILAIAAVVFIRIFDSLYSPSVRAAVGGAVRENKKYSSQFILTSITLSVALIAPLIIPITINRSVGFMFFVNALSYFLSMAGFLVGRSMFSLEKPKNTTSLRNWKGSIAEGWAEFKRLPVVKSVIFTLPIIDLALAATVVLRPAISERQTALDPVLFYSLIVLSAGASRIVGVFIGRHFIQEKCDGAFLALNCCVQGVLYLVSFMVVDSVLFLIPTAIIGIFSGIATLTVNEIIQFYSPESSKGKIFSLVGFIVIASMPLGPLISGFTARVDLSITFIIISVLLVTLGILPMRKKEIWSFKKASTI